MTALLLFTVASVVIGGGIMLATIVLSKNSRLAVLLRWIGRRDRSS